MSESNGEARQIDLGEDFGDVVVKANGAHVTISADGSLHVHSAPANDATSKAKHKIGYIESVGDHKGEIYGGIYPADKKPIWFSAAPYLMDHHAAATWAKENGGVLPTRKQGEYLTTLKRKGGGLTEIFNRGSLFPAGYIWLAEPYTHERNKAWCQRLSDGDQFVYSRFPSNELPVLIVRR